MPLTHNAFAPGCRESGMVTTMRRPGTVCIICTPQEASIKPGQLSGPRRIEDVQLPKHASGETEESSVLLEAEKLINGDRQDDYGSALASFDRIARLWEPILGTTVTAEQVAICLIQLKVARAMHDVDKDRPIKRDSIVDMAGYAGCLEQILREKYVE